MTELVLKLVWIAFIILKPEPGSTLDPTVHPDMNWIWGEGEYLFLKMTGTSPASKKDENFSYDIAGYQKNTNALQSVQNQFDVLMDVRQNAVPNIHYYVDILEVFKNPTDISIADLPYINSIGANAVMLSNNYKDMFIYQHIEN